jgi:nitrogenase iron protein NifH
LHIGCDPKHDSSYRLLNPEVRLLTVLEALAADPHRLRLQSVLNRGRLGITCCEAGGPEPGVGCAGRGVARTLEVLDEAGLLAADRYDVVLYDVLGDVVCGGFAAPLRAGFAQKVVIVTSADPMSLFAANNISKAVRTYRDNGVALAGLVANLRHAGRDAELLRLFAELIGTRVLASVPQDEAIVAAERRQQTLVESDPDSPTVRVFTQLAETLGGLQAEALDPPMPLADDEFFRFIRHEDATAEGQG